MSTQRKHGDPGRRGSVIDRVGLYEAVATIGFAGQRRRVYRRIVALSGARPGDKALDQTTSWRASAAVRPRPVRDFAADPLAQPPPKYHVP
jgi:hypothetical protein